MAVKNVVETVRDVLFEELRRDERVIVIGEDVGRRGGVFRATMGLIDEFGEQRVIDSPLAESAIVGVSIGAAMNGLVPVAEIQFADFIHPAMNQLISEAAKLRYRSNNDFGCPMVVRAPYGGNVHGALYHSQSLEGIFQHVPGLKVVAPTMPKDVKGLLKAAIRDPDPVLFLEHKGTYRLLKEEVPDDDYTIPIGVAAIKRAGRDVSVFTYGLMLHRVMEAAGRLETEGVEVEVVDLRTLQPLDTETILDSTRRTGKVLVVHEDNRTGGVGAEVAAVIAEQALFYLDAPIGRLTGPDVPAMPFARPLEEAFLPSVDDITATIRDLAAF